jgi:hypothetical protein
MSYSFDFTARDAETAKARVITEMDEVVRAQACHKKDRDAAIKTAHAFIDMLVEDHRFDIRVTVNGSLGYQYDATDPNCERTAYTQASIGASAWHVHKKD